LSIVVQGASKAFGGFEALKDVSIEVAGGSLTALLGPSGSGKSTLLRVIAGLEAPDEGTVHFGERDVTGVPPQKRGVGFCFQHYAAFTHMTVRQNVAFGLRVRRRPKDETRARVEELLRLVQLEGLGDRYPSQLSGGQRQRMALARALAVDPEVLLLDEPFGALDARVRSELREWLRRLHDEVHVTTILVTHDQEEAMEVADRIAVMDAGRIVQVGSPREIYEQPASEFVMSFVGHVNRLGEAWVRPHDIQIALHPNGITRQATIERLVHLGFEVRVELEEPDGSRLWAQVTRDDADELGLERGREVFLHPTRERVFAGEEREPAAAGAASG
jgi:sulfate/thiosulfate transport system ATP-binding protein